MFILLRHSYEAILAQETPGLTVDDPEGGSAEDEDEDEEDPEESREISGSR